jgi:hypothetical protein
LISDHWRKDAAVTADPAAIEQGIPKGAAAGDCYAPSQMAMIDSERRV